MICYSPASYGVANRFGYSKLPPRDVLERECRDEARSRGDYTKWKVIEYVYDRANAGEDWAVRCIDKANRKKEQKREYRLANKVSRREKKHLTPKNLATREVTVRRIPIGAPHPDYVRDDGFYNTRAWREVRMVALKAAGGRCACCGASAKDGARLHVDHIKPRYKRPDLSLVASNLQVLCEDCNFGKGAWDDTDWR